MQIIYIVIAANIGGDCSYTIDSVWKSERKAKKRCDELNSFGLDYLLEEFGCGLFMVEQKIMNQKLFDTQK